MKYLRAQICVFTLAVMALHAGGTDPAPRIWILPFENPRADASLEYLREGLPGLLAAAVSQTDEQALVERRHLDKVLAELSLTMEGLISRSSRRRVGKLVGATLLISGSFVKQEQGLLITMRASDIETGIITAAAEGVGPAAQVDELTRALYRDLARDLGGQLPDPGVDETDTAPLSNLHFMRGLGYYYSARYNRAIVEFMQASAEKELADISRLWTANAYLEQ